MFINFPKSPNKKTSFLLWTVTCFISNPIINFLHQTLNSSGADNRVSYCRNSMKQDIIYLWFDSHFAASEG